MREHSARDVARGLRSFRSPRQDRSCYLREPQWPENPTSLLRWDQLGSSHVGKIKTENWEKDISQSEGVKWTYLLS